MRQSPNEGILVFALTFVAALLISGPTVAAETGAKLFSLGNGLRVVVVPHRRTALVTHSVWYRAGSAEDPAGQSGLGHFLEHLMFRDSETLGAGEFSKIVARLGGQDEGVIDFDTTYYYQIIAPRHLSQVMKLEAQRMARLQLEDEAVRSEREVVLEELSSDTIEYAFDDQLRAVLYLSHPYKTPTIGWQHEVESLTRNQALAFHRRYYAPGNAVVVVVGDVTVNEVKALVAGTYGSVPANPNVDMHNRPLEPEPVAARRIELRDPRVGRPSFKRIYLVPSYATAKPGEAEALTLLMTIVADGPNSRLYRSLVIDEKIASITSGGYVGVQRDYGEISIAATPVSGRSLDDVEGAVDRVLSKILEEGISPEELARAMRKARANLIYESDDQQKLAERYGHALAVGQTIADVEAWPDRISRVTVSEVLEVAKNYLESRRSVTGYLMPPVSGIRQEVEPSEKNPNASGEAGRQ